MVKQLQSRWWVYLCLVVAVLYAIPVSRTASDRLDRVGVKMRAQLIIEHRLWELHPEYSGSPDMWTSFASRLLTDRQLLRRVRTLNPEKAEQIELDYRRDLSIAQGEILVVALAVWALPVAALYGAGLMVMKRRRTPTSPPPAARPTYDESRYRPGP